MKYSFIIRGPIGSWGTTASEVLHFLRSHPGTKLDIAVSSLGGSVVDALEIYQAFRDHGDVHVHFLGMNASAATFLAMGAKTVDIVKNGLLLIHNASTFVWECRSLNKEKLDQLLEEFKTTRDNLKTIDDVIASIYAEKTGKELSVFTSKMKEGKWITSKEAKELGLVDSIRDEAEDVSISAKLMVDYTNYYTGFKLPALPFVNDNDDFKMPDKIADEAPVNSKNSIKESISNFFNNKLKKKTMKHVFATLCGLLSVDSLESSNNVICLPVNDAQKVENRLAELEKKLSDAEKAKDDAINAKDEAVKAKSELEKELNETKNSLEGSKKQVDELKKKPGDDTEDAPDSTNDETCPDIYKQIKNLI